MGCAMFVTHLCHGGLCYVCDTSCYVCDTSLPWWVVLCLQHISVMVGCAMFATHLCHGGLCYVCDTSLSWWVVLCLRHISVMVGCAMFVTYLCHGGLCCVTVVACGRHGNALCQPPACSSLAHLLDEEHQGQRSTDH